MTNEMKNVPELRFPEFEDEWEIIIMRNITKKIGSGKTPKGGSSVYCDDGIPFLRSQNVRNGILNLDDLVYISKDTDESMKNSRTYYGDILLNITGASIGRSAINTIKKTYSNLNQHVCIIRLKNDYHFNFVSQYLLSNKGQKMIFLAQSGGSREGLNFKEIGNMKFHLPHYGKEQQKIGDFFSKLDRQIELEEQKLEKLEEQKKGYMQKIFSQQLRFKDENGNDYPEWKLCKLKDITISLKGQEKITKNLPILTISASKGWLKQEERFSQIIAGNSLKKYTHIKKGDLSYNKGNSKLAKYGIVYMLKEGEALVPNVYKSFRPKKYIASYFLEKYFHSQSVDRQLRTKISSTARMDGLLNISDKDFYEVNLKIPSYSEQDKIGSFFKKFDGFIGKQLNKVELLKERKKGFLQKMFV